MGKTMNMSRSDRTFWIKRGTTYESKEHAHSEEALKTFDLNWLSVVINTSGQMLLCQVYRHPRIADEVNADRIDDDDLIEKLLSRYEMHTTFTTDRDCQYHGDLMTLGELFTHCKIVIENGKYVRRLAKHKRKHDENGGGVTSSSDDNEESEENTRKIPSTHERSPNPTQNRQNVKPFSPTASASGVIANTLVPSAKNHNRIDGNNASIKKPLHQSLGLGNSLKENESGNIAILVPGEVEKLGRNLSEKIPTTNAAVPNNTINHNSSIIQYSNGDGNEVVLPNLLESTEAFSLISKRVHELADDAEFHLILAYNQQFGHLLRRCHEIQKEYDEGAIDDYKYLREIMPNIFVVSERPWFEHWSEKDRKNIMSYIFPFFIYYFQQWTWKNIGEYNAFIASLERRQSSAFLPSLVLRIEEGILAMNHIADQKLYECWNDVSIDWKTIDDKVVSLIFAIWVMWKRSFDPLPIVYPPRHFNAIIKKVIDNTPSP